jgi:aminopeptidase N
MEAVVPDMSALSQFVLSDVHVAMRGDDLRASHPVAVEVSRPEEIADIFDSVTYAKGAALIRMMDAFIGADTFRSGLTHYLSAL